MYVMGQSMGGAGVWHMTAHRPRVFAAAVACCGSTSLDKPADSVATPVWNFHGDADQTVPISVSRDRIAALRKAGAHPLHTEYAGRGPQLVAVGVHGARASEVALRAAPARVRNYSGALRWRGRVSRLRLKTGANARRHIFQ